MSQYQKLKPLYLYEDILFYTFFSVDSVVLSFVLKPIRKMAFTEEGQTQFLHIYT